MFFLCRPAYTEHCTTTAAISSRRRAVERTIYVDQSSHRKSAILEGVNYTLLSGRGDAEDRSLVATILATKKRRAVERAITSSNAASG